MLFRSSAMAVRAEEIASILKEQIEHFDVSATSANVGTVIEAGDGIARLQDAKRRGRDERAENDDSAQPDDEREQVHVPQRKHPRIIIPGLEDHSLPVQTSVRVPALMNIATRLRIDSVRSTSEAGSGHQIGRAHV